MYLTCSAVGFVVATGPTVLDVYRRCPAPGRVELCSSRFSAVTPTELWNFEPSLDLVPSSTVDLPACCGESITQVENKDCLSQGGVIFVENESCVLIVDVGK